MLHLAPLVYFLVLLAIAVVTGVLGSLLGLGGGTWLARRLPGATVRRICSAVLIVLAVQMLAKGVLRG